VGAREVKLHSNEDWSYEKILQGILAARHCLGERKEKKSREKETRLKKIAGYYARKLQGILGVRKKNCRVLCKKIEN